MTRDNRAHHNSGNEKPRRPQLSTFVNKKPVEQLNNGSPAFHAHRTRKPFQHVREWVVIMRTKWSLPAVSSRYLAIT